MHFDKIEDYNFDHGLEFNTQSGEYHSLNPHDLGRPLSHEEMDYNLMYQKQTLNGWRIAGSNDDLTLNNSDLGKVLAYHKVAVDAVDDPSNVMYDRHIAAGLFDGQYIWIPVQPGAMPFTTLDPCLGFDVAGVSFTNSLAYFVPDKNITYAVSSSVTNVAEGNVVVISINANDIDNDTTVSWTLSEYNNATAATTIAPVATTAAPMSAESNNNYGVSLYDPDNNERNPGDEPSITGNQGGFNELDIIGGVVSGEVTIEDGLASVVLQIKLDTIAESAELFKFQLAAQDSEGNDTGEPFAVVTIVDVYNPPTTTADPCVDDILYSIEECIDDITSQINDSTSATTINIGYDSSGGGNGVSGSGSGYGGGATNATAATTDATNATQATTIATSATTVSGGGGGQDTRDLTFDYHIPLTLDGYTYGLQQENRDSFGYYEDVSWNVSNSVPGGYYLAHEVFAEPYVGHEWTLDGADLVFEVDGNQITPDGTIQNNISIVTQIESDGRLSILTKSHNINEDRVHEIRITGGPELVDGSTPIDPPVQRPMLGLTAYEAWQDLVTQWEQENPNCQYYPDFNHSTGSFLQTKLGVSNTEMFDWGLGTAGRKRFMLRVLSETQALDMDLLNEFGEDQNCMESAQEAPTTTVRDTLATMSTASGGGFGGGDFGSGGNNAY